MSDPSVRLAAALADRYRIERELGAGGMATVYLAEDLRHERKVAIKVLKPELAAVLGAERFLVEIKTTAALNHPHILPLFDSGEADGFLFYVMPYIQGETIREKLARETQFGIDESLRITREVADALDYAHRHGVIHRDIKPENILLHDGRPMVMDFGIALAVQQAGGARMTQTGLSLGTPQYMAPEQAMGERQVDARADLYALGAVLYEMLTGEPPFTGATVQAIVAKVMTERPVAPSAVRDTVPPHVEAAVLKALAKLPADRHASAAEFATAIATAGAMPMARPATVRPARWRFAATAAIAVLALGAGWAVGRTGRTATTGRASVSVVLPDSIPMEPTHMNSEGMPTLAISPDGATLVFVGKKGRTTQLYLRRTASFDIRALDGTDGAFAPFFSPNGDAVAFFAADRLMTVSLADGHVTKVMDGVYEPFGGAWAPDGRFVLTTNRAGTLEVRSATGDSLQAVACTSYCALPELLPDGRHVLTSGSGAGISAVDLGSGATSPVRRWQAATDADGLRGSMPRYDGDGHLLWVSPNGDVLAAPFDPVQVALTGAPRVLAQGVRVETGRGAAQFALASGGTFAFAPGPLRSVGIVVLADRSGRLDTVRTAPADYTRFDLAPDGRRILAAVAETDGTSSVEVIDAETGQVTPWVRSPRPVRQVGWAPGGALAWYERGSALFQGDPTVVTAPDSLPIAVSSGYRPFPDGQRYLHLVNDTIVAARYDGTGEVLRIPVSASSAGIITDDARWFVEQELVGRSAGIVAHSLDGTRRRLIVSNSPDYSMVWSTPGSNEVIVAVNGLTSALATGTVADEQSFWRIAYTPGAAQPFGEPTLLFRASVADFPGRNYAAGMRGQRFVFKQHIAAPPPREIRLVQGWHALLDDAARGGGR